MKTFELLDISGDAGIRAFGRDLRELFIAAACGMYSLITDPVRVTPEKTLTVTVESKSLEGLFISWLNELIFHFDTYGFVGKNCEIADVAGGTGADPAWRLSASLSGEDFDEKKHERGLLLKAATYHRLRIEKTGDLWEAEVIFDI